MKKLILFILLLFLSSCFFNDKNKCYYGKDRYGQCITLDYLENNDIRYSKYGYILKKEAFIIDDRFKLFEKRNFDILSGKIGKLKLFEVNNLDIFYLNKILEKLNIKNIENLKLKCISKNNLLSLVNIIKNYRITNLTIDNILCGNNNDFSGNNVKVIFNLKLDKLIFNVGGSYLDDIEKILKNSKLKDVLVGTCEKKGEKIKINNRCGIN